MVVSLKEGRPEWPQVIYNKTLFYVKSLLLKSYASCLRLHILILPITADEGQSSILCVKSFLCLTFENVLVLKKHLNNED